ncbi:MAG: ribosome maturation factor RimP [candidate division KSB1 bacterium]|nr:ribosome maturation factor RimP [candidate division KSB1 bacterium]
MADTHDIRRLVEQALADEEVDLLDVALRGRPGRQLLRVLVDVEGGITLDHCARLAQKISDMLDRKDPIPGSYTLEVSSPGVDWPLRTERDFRRNLRRTLKVEFQDGEATRVLIGVLQEVGPEYIVIECAGQLQRVALETVRLAKVQPKW